MQIGIIGCGTMGAGIAQVAAEAGEKVIVYDVAPIMLEKAKNTMQKQLQALISKNKISNEYAEKTMNAIEWSFDIHSLSKCELIIEAIVENLDIKQKLFIQLESIVTENTILATNTSSLSVTAIAAACKKAERVIGIHFFNPATRMQLVEIIPALQTENQIIQSTIAIINSWKKLPVIAKDTPGFIVNRIARPFYSEAIRIAEEGIANIATIDYAMKQYGGFRMGPFELMDMIGHDVNYVVTETVWKSFFYDHKYTPSHMQKKLLEAGWLGRKSGKGFYQYIEGEIQITDLNTDEDLCKNICDRILVMLFHEANHALHLKIASREDIETAMTKGVNYPKGLLTWSEEFGYEKIEFLLDQLFIIYHEERYRCSPYIRLQASLKK